MLGEMIRNARKTQGRSLRDVADEMAMSYGHLSDIENGKCGMSFGRAISISLVLGLDLNDMAKELRFSR